MPNEMLNVNKFDKNKKDMMTKRTFGTKGRTFEKKGQEKVIWKKKHKRRTLSET